MINFNESNFIPQPEQRDKPINHKVADTMEEFIAKWETFMKSHNNSLGEKGEEYLTLADMIRNIEDMKSPEEFKQRLSELVDRGIITEEQQNAITYFIDNQDNIRLP